MSREATSAGQNRFCSALRLSALGSEPLVSQYGVNNFIGDLVSDVRIRSQRSFILHPHPFYYADRSFVLWTDVGLNALQIWAGLEGSINNSFGCFTGKSLSSKCFLNAIANLCNPMFFCEVDGDAANREVTDRYRPYVPVQYHRS